MAGRWGAAALGVLAVLLALPALAQSRDDAFNPCDLSGFDAPCTVPGGVYRALKPPGPGPFPTVMFLHGSGGRADNTVRNSYFQRTVIDRGYALIVPRALSVVNYTTGRDTGWSLRSRRRHPRDDVGFLRRVLEHATDRFRIDRRRVLVAGQSDGGFLIWEIACHDPDMAAAYAVHAGSYGGRLPERCRTPVRFLQTHGRADRIVPFEAERRAPGGGRIDAADVREGLALLARTNGCAGTRSPVDTQSGRFLWRRWTGCATGSSLNYLIHNGGHSFPGSWMPTVLTWFEDVVPERERTKRVIHRPGERSSRFKSVGD